MCTFCLHLIEGHFYKFLGKDQEKIPVKRSDQKGKPGAKRDSKIRRDTIFSSRYESLFWRKRKNIYPVPPPAQEQKKKKNNFVKNLS